MDSFSYLDSEDFGLAKSFTSAPICAMAPNYNYSKKDGVEVENQIEDLMKNELISDGFCFKLAPG